MTVFNDKRRNRWSYDFRYEGQRYSGYCVNEESGEPARNRKQALAIEEALKVRLRSGSAINSEHLHEYTVAECFSNWLDSLGNQANRHNAEDHVREFLSRPEFNPTKLLAHVSDLDVERYIQWAQQQPLKIYLGGPNARSAEKRQKQGLFLWRESDRLRSSSTVNHYLATLKAAFNYAARLRVNGAPLLKYVPAVRKLKVPVREVRAFLDSELEALITNSGSKVNKTQSGKSKIVQKRPLPQYVIDAVLLCRLMGFRRREVIGLDIRNIDDARKGYWLRAEETKGNRDELVLAQPDAWSILVRLREQAVMSGNTRLILARGPSGRSKEGPLRPIKNFRSSFDRGMKEAGFKGKYTFHNTKAAFVTAITEVTDSATTQKLARHRDYKTTQKYIASRDGRKSAAIDAMQVSIEGPLRKIRLQGLFTLLAKANRNEPEEW